MKMIRKAFAASVMAAGLFGACVFALNSATTNSSSSTTILAAVDFCTPTEKLDCLSPATGNIYTGYKLVSVNAQIDKE